MQYKLINCLKNNKKPHVLVLGDFIHDQYVIGHTHRISPEGPIPILDVQNIQNKLGGAGNVIENLRNMGAHVSTIFCKGEDDSSNWVADELRSWMNRKDCPIIETKKHTPFKMRFIAGSQQLLRVDQENNEPINKECQNNYMEWYRALLETHMDVIIVSDYDKGTLPDYFVMQMLVMAKKRNIPVIVDPPKNKIKKYPGVMCIKPNFQELNSYHCMPENTETYWKIAMEHLLNQQHLDYVVLTLSDKGLAVMKRGDNDITYIPSEAHDVYDVCGAGDSALAGLAFSIGKGLNMIDAAYVANICGGIACSHLGTYPVSINDILNHLSPNITKIQDLLSLVSVVHKHKDEGKKIVFCNGCFDVLHPGHISLLHYAKKQGDILVVATNTDDSIKKLKGSNRPIISLEDRMKTLASLESVDYVISFDSTTPTPLMKNIRPHIYVQGEDHKKDATDKYADKIIFFKHVGGYSTSNIIGDNDH
jgi:D-beta-D-heptose 7-phosphate kinase/D-beta-D-heptose 1-phosphate adenosyltransferase